MKASDLQKALEDHLCGDDGGRPLIAAGLIEWTDRGNTTNRGVAVCIGENLSRIWQSGDVIVFWDNGDHTMLVGGEIEPDTEIKVFHWFTDDGLIFNLFDKRVFSLLDIPVL